MNAILARHGRSVRRKQYTKKTKREIQSETRDTDGNNIVQRLGETFGIFHRVAAK